MVLTYKKRCLPVQMREMEVGKSSRGVNAWKIKELHQARTDSDICIAMATQRSRIASR